MKRKIKSVKLNKDFNNGVHFVGKGTLLLKGGNNNTYYTRFFNDFNLFFDEMDIRKNSTGLFDIEYEPERKSITVKIEYNSYDDKVIINSRDIYDWICINLPNPDLTVTEVIND